jgi:hypothetical protein
MKKPYPDHIGLRQLCDLCGSLRALRQRISLSRADSFCAKLAKDRKARGGGVVSKEDRPLYLSQRIMQLGRGAQFCTDGFENALGKQIIQGRLD